MPCSTKRRDWRIIKWLTVLVAGTAVLGAYCPPSNSTQVGLATGIVSSIDIAAFQANRQGAWFSGDLSTLPTASLTPQVFFDIKDWAVANRKNGKISTNLLSGYFFIQWSITSSSFASYASTVKGLFLRSALLSFVDYPNNKVLDWWRKSSVISTDLIGVLQVCNQKNIPVFLEINYADYIPGPLGTGVESLTQTDNIANTKTFLRALKSNGIQITGVTFGDEIEDEAGFGNLKPTIWNSNLIGRFIAYAKGIKTEFPEAKIYAFQSYIAATRGRVSFFLDLLPSIRQEEISSGLVLLDGFVFNESYNYISADSNLLDSQLILDDTESLYRNTPVYRYDYDGSSHPNPDKAYLPEIIDKTKEIFSRDLDIGITEYLPAIPFQMGEIDTSRYSDFDFIIHFADVVGIYAQLGLDFVSKIMFGDSVNMHKSYFDRAGNLGANFPVHAQLAQYFSGELMEVTRSLSYDSLKVKIYAARQGAQYFIMVLNKELSREATIAVNLSEKFFLTVRLPARSYTSFLFDGNKITVSGIGEGTPGKPRTMVPLTLLLLED